MAIWLRAGFVLGRGSALFDVLGHLVRKFPLLLVPRWRNNPIDWIALADVLHDLIAAIDVSVRDDLVVDIGPLPASVREMVETAGRALGVKRLTVSVPISLPRRDRGQPTVRPGTQQHKPRARWHRRFFQVSWVA